MRENEFVLGCQGVELVFCSDECLAGQFADLFGNEGIKALRGVQAGTNSGAAEGELMQGLEGELQKLDITFEGRTPAADFLTELDGRGILQMGTAGLDDALVFSLQTQEGGGQPVRAVTVSLPKIILIS